MTMTQPNLLVILSDQHNPFYSGPYGHAVVQTPHLDRLAAEGVVFENAYTSSPICVPARMSFMTGRHVQNIGVWDNGVPLPSDIPTWAHWVRAAGYDAVLAGKIHFRGLDQRHGFRAQLARDINAENRPNIPDWSKPLPTPQKPRAEMPARPGYSKEIEADDRTEAAALRYLHDSARRDQPWAMVAGFVAPHPPFVVPRRYYEQYPTERVDLPTITAQQLANQHPANQRLRAWRGIPDQGVTAESARRAHAAYYGLVTYLDEKIGRLLDALEETGQRQNTVVVYVSDHGEMLGEHGLWHKCCFYEGSVHIPLIISWPGILPAGRRVQEVVSLVDLTATLLDLAEAPAIAPLDGGSLLSLARGEDPTWRNDALAEFYADGSTRPWAMLRRGRYKLVYSHEEAPELYDLATDPQELHDLVADPACQKIRDELIEQLLARWNPAALDRRIRQSQRERRLMYNSLFDYLST